MANKVQIIDTGEGLALNIPGKGFYQVLAGTAAYDKVRQLQNERKYDEINTFVDVPSRLEAYAKGRFVIIGGEIFFKGDVIPGVLASRVLQFCEQDIDPTPLMRFWDNLKDNPSKDSREDLFSFLEHNGISITADGCFVGYKRVADDYMDLYTHKISNKPGEVPEMDRASVDQDRNHTCSSGLHIAAYDYANTKYYGGAGHLMEVKINPADVVCVPPDYDQEKMRVCKYTVVRECTEEYTKPLYAYDNSYNNPDDDYDYECDDNDDDDFVDDNDDDGFVDDDSNSLEMTLTSDRRGRVRIPAELMRKINASPGDTVCCYSDTYDNGKRICIYVSSYTEKDEDVLYTVDQYCNVRVNLKHFPFINSSKILAYWEENEELIWLEKMV